MIFLVLLVTYTILGLYMEHKKPPIGHETGIIIIIGMIVSYTIKLAVPGNIDLLQFNTNIFFEACLPLIIFASGYNLKRK